MTLHDHIWVRRGVGTGGNLDSVLWGETTCLICGVVLPSKLSEAWLEEKP